MRRSGIAIAVLCAGAPAVFGAPGPARAEGTCPGPVLNPHPLGTGVSFDTNSAPSGTPAMPLVDDCVQDRDPASPIRIDWYATALHGVWALPGAPPTHAPRPVPGDPADARPLRSCIGYGSIGRTTTALILGTAADLAADAGHPDCSTPDALPRPQSHAMPDPTRRRPSPVSYDLTFGVPSHAGPPEATMVLVQAHVTLRPSGDGYATTVAYDLIRRGARADLSELGVRPALAGEAARLAPSLADSFPKHWHQLVPQAPPGAARAAGSLSFAVAGGAAWHAVPARFELTNRAHTLLGAIDLPLLVPVP